MTDFQSKLFKGLTVGRKDSAAAAKVLLHRVELIYTNKAVSPWGKIEEAHDINPRRLLKKKYTRISC